MNIDDALDGKVSPRTPLPKNKKKLLDQLLKKYNILSDIEV